jgi:NAD(P)-dependent dehydrogenase (short-subunit alcohol dehydrogenase family)
MVDDDVTKKIPSMNSPVILITGATRGIGFAAARELKRRGATVLLGSRDPERARKAAAEIGAEPIPLDITQDQSIADAVALVEARHGRLDVLVNNGAILLDHYQGLLDLSPDTLRETLETNLIGTFRVTRGFLPLLRRAAAPRVINLASGAGQLDGEPQPWAPAYSISKTALNMLTQQFTAAVPEVIFNSMCPGWCRTEMGGEDAPLTPEQGADTLVWLALDAPNDLKGAFVKERRVIPW